MFWCSRGPEGAGSCAERGETSGSPNGSSSDGFERLREAKVRAGFARTFLDVKMALKRKGAEGSGGFRKALEEEVADFVILEGCYCMLLLVIPPEVFQFHFHFLG